MYTRHAALNINNIWLYWFECKFTTNSCPQKEAVIPCSCSNEVSGVFAATALGAGTGLNRGFEAAVQNRHITSIHIVPPLCVSRNTSFALTHNQRHKVVMHKAFPCTLCVMSVPTLGTGNQVRSHIIWSLTKQDFSMLGNLRAGNIQPVFTTIPTKPICFSTYIL